MAYFRSAMRRMTLDSATGPHYFWQWGTPWGNRGYNDDEETATGSYDAWCWAADRLQDRDSELVKTWADQADGLVTFAALFSSVITSFIIESYTTLQPDPRIITINLLRQIAAHLDEASHSTSFNLPNDAPFEPALADVVRNAALFASLICTLLAAGMGIFYKEWLREYTRGTPTDPRELTRVRQHRYLGMLTWRMQEILSAISIFLQLGVAFFIISVILFAWPLHPIVRLVLNIFAIVWIVFWIGTAFCPLFSDRCPFRSPLSRTIFTAMSIAKWLLRKAGVLKGTPEEDVMLQTLETQERISVNRHGRILDSGALYYLYTEHWGDPHLAALDLCIEDLPKAEAQQLILDIASPRCPSNTPFKEVIAGKAQLEDADVMRLAKLWDRFEKQAEWSSTATMPQGRGGVVRPLLPGRPPMPGRYTTLVGTPDLNDGMSLHTIEDGKNNSVVRVETLSTGSSTVDPTLSHRRSNRRLND
ncbi:hypothetical protein BC628DRAFT_1201194 [Trametes gibbosa]|nr:hypothetical protein BC628DRAFT_1201194 [Trametes gibbosa]